MTVLVTLVQEVRVRAPDAMILVSPVSIPAGFPSPSQDYYENGIDLNKHLIADTTSTFIVPGLRGQYDRRGNQRRR